MFATEYFCDSTPKVGPDPYGYFSKNKREPVPPWSMKINTKSFRNMSPFVTTTGCKRIQQLLVPEEPTQVLSPYPITGDWNTSMVRMKVQGNTFHTALLYKVAYKLVNGEITEPSPETSMIITHGTTMPQMTFRCVPIGAVEIILYRRVTSIYQNYTYSHLQYYNTMYRMAANESKYMDQLGYKEIARLDPSISSYTDTVPIGLPTGNLTFFVGGTEDGAC